jgi:hypothetical protein
LDVTDYARNGYACFVNGVKGTVRRESNRAAHRRRDSHRPAPGAVAHVAIQHRLGLLSQRLLIILVIVLLMDKR